MKNGIIFLILIAALLAACGSGTATPPPAIAENTRPSPTDTLTPTKILTPPAVFVPPTMVPPPPACFHLLTPEDGLSLPANLPAGILTFSWEPVPDAANYSVDIIVPTGQTINFVFAETSQGIPTQNIEIPGLYEWQVTALSVDGTVICSSEKFGFGKQQ